MDEWKIRKLESFLKKVVNDVYPEHTNDAHIKITQNRVEYIVKNYSLPIDKILDVGCGEGFALDLFSQYNMDVIGITLGSKDLEICISKGHTVHKMDQSFLDFPEDRFGMIWCRHCLEHSVFPYFTLHGFQKVLITGGYLYIEVPASGTDLNHERNINHYSIFGKSNWEELILRSGFEIIESVDIPVQYKEGNDLYWSFIGRNYG